MTPRKRGKLPPEGRGFKSTKPWNRVAYSEFTHEVVEHLRSSRLRSLTIRLGEEQIAEARMEAERTGVPYQTILRQWVAFGAANAQRTRTRTRTSSSKHGK
jgi:predicted DNA binding CopG/RHH family protein